MKIFIIASMLFGGGTAAALTNEEVADTLTEKIPSIVRERFTNNMENRKDNRIETVKEEGISYPTEERLALLTEDQQLAIVALIDQYNLENDFTVLTDEEIQAVLDLFHADMVALAEELGLELPDPEQRRDQLRDRIRENVTARMNERLQNKTAQGFEDIKENGFVLNENSRLELTEEQTLALEAKVAEINAAYDFTNMTDEELTIALDEIKDDLHELFTELEIALPAFNQNQHNHSKQGSQGSQRKGK